MIITPDMLIKAARECLDTPFLHQGRIKGLGLDCAGFIAHPAVKFNLGTNFDRTDYPKSPDSTALGRILDEHMEKRVTFGEKLVADVFWMAFNKQPQHLAIITELYPLRIIHADAFAPGGGRVVEHILDSIWIKRIRAVYRYPGVTF